MRKRRSYQANIRLVKFAYDSSALPPTRRSRKYLMPTMKQGFFFSCAVYSTPEQRSRTLAKVPTTTGVVLRIRKPELTTNYLGILKIPRLAAYPSPLAV